MNADELDPRKNDYNTADTYVKDPEKTKPEFILVVSNSQSEGPNET